MNRLNLPPSEERLADQAYWNSPEGLAIIAAELQALRDLFDKPHKRRNDDPI